MNNHNRFKGESKEATILVSDIKNFTKITEFISPEKIINFLNEFYLENLKIVNNYRGIINKLTGDGILTINFAKAHAINTVLSALEMLRSINKLSESWSGMGLSGLDLRIGIDTGQVIHGYVDSKLKKEKELIIEGNTIRLALKLEKLNKELNTKILISETTFEKVKKLIYVREHKNITIPGILNSRSVFEVAGVHQSLFTL